MVPEKIWCEKYLADLTEELLVAYAEQMWRQICEVLKNYGYTDKDCDEVAISFYAGDPWEVIPDELENMMKKHNISEGDIEQLAYLYAYIILALEYHEMIRKDAEKVHLLYGQKAITIVPGGISIFSTLPSVHNKVINEVKELFGEEIAKKIDNMLVRDVLHLYGL